MKGASRNARPQTISHRALEEVSILPQYCNRAFYFTRGTIHGDDLVGPQRLRWPPSWGRTT